MKKRSFITGFTMAVIGTVFVTESLAAVEHGYFDYHQVYSYLKAVVGGFLLGRGFAMVYAYLKTRS